MGIPTTVGRNQCCVKIKNIPHLIQNTKLFLKKAVYGDPHDRGAQPVLRKNTLIKCVAKK